MTKKKKIEVVKRYYGLTIKEAINFLDLLKKDEEQEIINNMEAWLNGQSKLAFLED